MTRDDILTLLKNVNYPGFSRDIVSFGMVTDIDLEGDRARVVLAVSTDNEDQKAKLTESVTGALQGQQGIQHVDVEIVKPQARGNGQTPAQGEAAMDVASPIPGVKHTIAVASGKGGVGKSTVAVNLATALSMTGADVGILDLDIYGPSLPMILGIDERPYLNEDQKILPLEKHGMKLMSFGLISGNQAPTIWRGPLVARMTQQFFDDVAWGELDYLILDLPPGTGDVQLTLVQRLALAGAIIVTTPQQLALVDVRKGADMFSKVNTPVLGVVENMAGLPLEGAVTDGSGKVIPGAKLEFQGLGEVKGVDVDQDGRFRAMVPIFRAGGGDEESQRLEVPLLGRVPLIPDLVVASDEGEPYVMLHPDSLIGQTFIEMAHKVISTVKDSN